MKRFVTISVPEAARMMNKSNLFVYEGMKRGALPIGEAIQMPGSSKFTYFISPALFANYLGVSVEEVFEEVRRIRCQTAEDTAS